MRKKIAIVGNAPINYDLSDMIDSCDIVVRFNEYPRWGNHSGRKTDVLCVCNTGTPAEKMSTNRMILNAPFYHSSLEVWFPRNEDVHQSHIVKYCAKFNQAKYYKDLSGMLINSNQLSADQVISFSPELNDTAFNKLMKVAKWPFIVPSTGFLTMEYILNEPRFSDYDKSLVGFSFRGWRGHPWEAEKAITLDYTHTRSDFHYISTFPKPLSSLHNLYSDLMIWKKRRKIVREL